MITRFTRSMLVVQLLAVIALAALFVAMGTIASLPLALLAGVLIVTLPRAAIGFNNFFMAKALHRQRQDGTLIQTTALITMMLQEFYWSSVCWLAVFPFATFRARLLAQDRGLPVLLIHGYGCNSGFWYRLSKRLARAGISQLAIDLEPLLADIDDYTTLIDEGIDALCRHSESTQVIVLAHSMGGLAARAYLRRHGQSRVARVITLGSPHFGSTMAQHAMGINAAQMRHTALPDTHSWLQKLASAEAESVRALFVSIYSRHDNIVSPQDSAVLPGARNISLDLVGHVALGFDAGVMQLVLTEITAARQNRFQSEN